MAWEAGAIAVDAIEASLGYWTRRRPRGSLMNLVTVLGLYFFAPVQA